MHIRSTYVDEFGRGTAPIIRERYQTRALSPSRLALPFGG